MKRTIKRLEALAQGKSGVQINMSRSRIKVSTRYTPLVVGVGKTLPGAVEDCVHWLLDWLKDHPYWAPKLKNVLDALHEQAEIEGLRKRTVQILDALSKATGGVQVNISNSGAKVTTHYTPLARGKGKTLQEAVEDCARQLQGCVAEYPGFRLWCPDVLATLETLGKHDAV